MSLKIIILLYLSGLILLIAEVFVPGMILGILGTILLGSSIYFSFRDYGSILGLVQVFITVIILPLLIWRGLRRLSLNKSLTVEEGFRGETLGLEQLLGKEGITLTTLRPAGVSRIEGRKIDVVTEGELIPPNQPVRVIKVEGNRVVVRALPHQANIYQKEPSELNE